MMSSRSTTAASRPARASIAALAAVFLLIAMAPTARAACLHDGMRVEGQLRRIETRHPNGTRLSGYHLFLANPICVRAERSSGGKGTLSDIHTVQLVPADDSVARELDSLLGARITASGAFMEPQTVYHTGDIVLLDARILVVADRPAPAAERAESARGAGEPETAPETSARPMPSDPAEIRARFARFIREFYLAGYDLSAEEIAEIYAPRLFYFGKARFPVKRVVADKIAYYKRWPERRYALLEDTLRIRPARQRENAWDLAFEYTFELAGPRRTRRGRGIAYITVDLSGGRVRILREHGKVLKRF